MAEHRTAEHWDQRYRDGALPWDSGLVSPVLIATIDALGLQGGDALELGCGTGTNAIWLARRGFRTTAVDMAPRAIDMARDKSRAAGVTEITFAVADVLDGGLPVAPGSVTFAFDRGCLHSVAEADRPAFVRHVAGALRPDGWWLLLSGNADQPRGDEPGPPQLTAAALVGAVEPHFAIHDLRRTHFHGADGPTFLAWSCLMRLRGGVIGDR